MNHHNNSVNLIISLNVKEERLGEFVDIIRSSKKGASQEKGCSRFEVFQDPSDPLLFWLNESFDDDAAHQIHC